MADEERADTADLRRALIRVRELNNRMAVAANTGDDLAPIGMEIDDVITAALGDGAPTWQARAAGILGFLAAADSEQAAR